MAEAYRRGQGPPPADLRAPDLQQRRQVPDHPREAQQLEATDPVHQAQ